MTVWARSDLASITVSPAHGGCGAVHTRPAPGGNPVPVWDLTCNGGCEDHLRGDSLWGVSPETIPETPDEIAARESNEKRTQRDQQAKNVEVMEKLGNLPEGLAQAMLAVFGPLLAQNGLTAPQSAPQTEPGTVPDPAAPDRALALPQGENAALTPNQLSELQDALNTMSADPAWAYKTVDVTPEPPNLDAMNMPALNDYAKSLGLPGRRSRAEQIDAIRNHLGM